MMGLTSTQVLRIDLDLNGDGRPEVLLANSEKCGNGGCPWNIYSPTARSGAGLSADRLHHLDHAKVVK